MLNAYPNLMGPLLCVLLMSHGLLINFGMYKYVDSLILLLSQFYHRHSCECLVEQTATGRESSCIHHLCR